MRHRPVMLREVLTSISAMNQPKLVIDATFGGGGHSKAILESFSAVKVLGVDRDPYVANNILKPQFEQFIADNRISLLTGQFSALEKDIKSAISLSGNTAVADVVLFDLGYSNNQVIDRDIGISYFRDQKLDMRLDRSDRPTASQILNWSCSSKLSKIFKEHGELRSTERLVRNIINTRIIQPFETSSDLINVIHSSGMNSFGEIAKVFQSLRIEVNDEKNEIIKSIKLATKLIHQNGLVLVIAFNRLEQSWIKSACTSSNYIMFSKIKAPQEEPFYYNSAPIPLLVEMTGPPNFYEKSLSKNKSFDINLSSLAFLYCEYICRNKEIVHGVAELEEKLSALGSQVGRRLYELNIWRERTAKRETVLLNILLYVSNAFWKSINGKAADSLEKSVENENEYMIIDNDPLISRFISTPKELSALNCAAFYCGTIEAVLESNGYTSKVSAHFSSTPEFPMKTVFLIKIFASNEN